MKPAMGIVLAHPGAMPATQTKAPDLRELSRRVRAEYLEMPGLCLTDRQARRIWNLDEVRCDAVLRALVDAQFLRRTPQGGYVRR
jgi:hypothetical protein